VRHAANGGFSGGAELLLGKCLFFGKLIRLAQLGLDLR
jgi:hypothetical protein